jgi:hypothetical protein
MDMSQIGNMVSMLNSMGGVDFNNLLKSSGLGDKLGQKGCETNRSNPSSLILIIIIVLLCCCNKRRGVGSGCNFNNNNCLDDCCCLCKKKDRKRCEKLKKKIRKAKCQCCGECDCCEYDCCEKHNNCGSSSNNSCGYGGFGGLGNCFGGLGNGCGTQGSGIIIWIIFAILILRKFSCGANGLGSILESLGDKDECDRCLD